MKRTAKACLCFLAMTMGTASVLANGGHGGGHSGGHAHHGGGAVQNGANPMRVQGSNVHVGNAVQHTRVQNHSPFNGQNSQVYGSSQVQNKTIPMHQHSTQKVNSQNNGQVFHHNNAGQNNNQHHLNNGNAGSFLSHHGKNHQHQGSNMSPVKLHQNHSNGISHHHFTGQKVNFGKQHVNLSSASYVPSFYKHGNHYHGNWNSNQASNHHHHHPGWNNNWGLGYYNSGWGYQPYFWGVGGWGLGSMVYSSGYLGYYNPYYSNAVATGYCYNYAQPIPVSYNAVVADAGTSTSTPASSNVMDAAVLAFQKNDFGTALDLTNQGIQQSPDDAVLHEFRGLVLFAKGDYQQAAATVHSVLAVGPGWDWETLSGLYPDVGVYTNQLRALEAYTKQNPQDAAGHFLLAYHYMSDGYPDAATRQLQQVKEIVPNDMVAANLLKMTTASQSASPAAPSAPPTQNVATTTETQPNVEAATPPAPAAIDPTVIVGSWTASRDDGSNFGLTLKDDKTFSWSFVPKNQQPQSFDGTYKMEGNVIALERTGGGSLLAEIAANDRSKFNFKMLGAPDEDPGLTFIR